MMPVAGHTASIASWGEPKMNDESTTAAAQVAAIGKQFYRGYMLAPARTPGKVRVLNADASAVLPLSLRIYDGAERARVAIREHLVGVAAAKPLRA
jgi:hypothetical protein